ncbi:uncharacterized protein LOC126821956 isoform X2 [Patella vulgata]|uniref:uncharacterized protein LOC126821956 isoform X2 n=1 Tax=Patella vulgata TaxID=6465 RepID=UPI0024A7F300|nr:uncharacterized protein LOC126821956 isoform X2 [Patella vulgata]
MEGMRRAKTSYDLYGEHPPGSSYGVTAYVPVSSPVPRPPVTCTGRTTPLQRPKTRQSLIVDNGIQQRPSTRQSLLADNGPQQRPSTRQSLLADNGPQQRPISRQSVLADNGTQTEVADVSTDNHPYSGSMDPVNRHYYFREWCRNPPRPQMPLNRSGRLGSTWRHVKTTFNPHGSHIAFIDGTVKEEENYFYPPELMYQPPNFTSYIPPRMFATPSLSASPKQPKYRTTYNNKAKQGFKYWYQDPKPIDSYEMQRRAMVENY